MAVGVFDLILRLHWSGHGEGIMAAGVFDLTPSFALVRAWWEGGRGGEHGAGIVAVGVFETCRLCSHWRGHGGELWESVSARPDPFVCIGQGVVGNCGCRCLRDLTPCSSRCIWE